MTYKQVYQALSGIEKAPGEKIPVAYLMFPADDPQNPPPDPPFICYYYTGSDDLLADNTNFQKIRPLTVELYTDNKDFAIEDAVETALNAAGLVFSRMESYIEAEKMYMVSYETEIIVTEE